MKTKLILLLLSVFILTSVVFSLETKGVKTDSKEKINQTEVKKAPFNKVPLKKVNQENNPKKRKKNPELQAEMEKIKQEFEREKSLIADKYKNRIQELRKQREEEIDRLRKEFNKRRNVVKNKYKK